MLEIQVELRDDFVVGEKVIFRDEEYIVMEIDSPNQLAVLEKIEENSRY